MRPLPHNRVILGWRRLRGERNDEELSGRLFISENAAKGECGLSALEVP
jgi:hypothetical protein